jgi:CBS-domain-containing membrane protein
MKHFSQAFIVFIHGFIAVGILGALAVFAGASFLFPSVGPTAFLLFHDPLAPTASPRNTLCGHAIGIVSGYLALVVTGLTDAPSAMVTGIDAPRVLAAALSLGLTGSVMSLFNVVHAPAGATTLIISLGIITAPRDLAIIELAMVVLVAYALVVHRLSGVNYPFWAPPKYA